MSTCDKFCKVSKIKKCLISVIKKMPHLSKLKNSVSILVPMPFTLPKRTPYACLDFLICFALPIQFDITYGERILSLYLRPKCSPPLRVSTVSLNQALILWLMEVKKANMRAKSWITTTQCWNFQIGGEWSQIVVLEICKDS